MHCREDRKETYWENLALINKGGSFYSGDKFLCYIYITWRDKKAGIMDKVKVKLVHTLHTHIFHYP